MANRRKSAMKAKLIVLQHSTKLRSLRRRRDWRALRLGFGLSIVDSLSQHLAQLRLGFRRFAVWGLPLGHQPHVGMLEAELNPSWDCPRPIIHVRFCVPDIKPCPL
jgi:hypothetical protein